MELAAAMLALFRFRSHKFSDLAFAPFLRQIIGQLLVLRGKRFFGSCVFQFVMDQFVDGLLDGLPGIGPVRKRALLNHFGSPEAILAASREELQGVPGLPAKTARDIHALLHRAG